MEGAGAHLVGDDLWEGLEDRLGLPPDSPNWLEAASKGQSKGKQVMIACVSVVVISSRVVEKWDWMLWHASFFFVLTCVKCVARQRDG